jgi:hypothetical protein
VNNKPKLEYSLSYDIDNKIEDFKYVRHPKLYLETLLLVVTNNLKPLSTKYSSYDLLRRVSDSLDPLSLYLFLLYLSASNKLFLLSFLRYIDPCEPFKPRTF